MNFDEYGRLDALGMAGLVGSGDVTPEELLNLARQRLDSVNPTLNAVIADVPPTPGGNGRFHGVPFLLKDIFHHVRGLPTSCGSRAFAAIPADHDSTFVQRCRAAGLVVFGKTNLPELGLKAVSENDLHGATRNPWNTALTPGGSSGGAAAAVAAGVVPMAAANDGGGSIRIPAAYCGLFGLKPSRGRVPPGPSVAEVWEGACSDHVITRTVRDSAAMLDALHGADAGAPFDIPPPERPYLDECSREPGRLRIAYSVHSPIDRPVHPDHAGAVERTAVLLQGLGHEVEEAAPAIDGMELARCYLMLYFGQVAAMVRGRSVRGFELDTRALAMLGRALDSGAYVRAHARWNTFSRAMGAFLSRYDLYLTPTTATPPAQIGALQTPWLERLALRPLLWLRAGRLLLHSGMVEKLALRSLERTPFTQLANLTGLPAMSVPLFLSGEGLPVGSHFTAPFGREDQLFRLAAQLEGANPWGQRLPRFDIIRRR